jgi:rubrerythrin
MMAKRQKDEDIAREVNKIQISEDDHMGELDNELLELPSDNEFLQNSFGPDYYNLPKKNGVDRVKAKCIECHSGYHSLIC